MQRHQLRIRLLETQGMLIVNVVAVIVDVLSVVAWGVVSHTFVESCSIIEERDLSTIENMGTQYVNLTPPPSSPLGVSQARGTENHLLRSFGTRCRFRAAAFE